MHFRFGFGQGSAPDPARGDTMRSSRLKIHTYTQTRDNVHNRQVRVKDSTNRRYLFAGGI